MQLFARFNDVGVTLLIATHDLDLLDHLGHRRIQLEGGRLTRDSKQ
jgi:cell division transport system ATP-binding protein